ncbi:MAG TPA: AAA family ATPase [bacterium]|nr:AAA family ATPase [bacterium]
MWSSVIGHRRQIERLKAALFSKRLPNAYIFAGPRGVGKRLVADELAFSAVCTSPLAAGEGACRRCPSCCRAASGSHPDLAVVMAEVEQERLHGSAVVRKQRQRAEEGDPGKKKKPPSEEIKTLQILDLQKRMYLHREEAPLKIAIIDEAERMNEYSQNRLLKILEEPPEATHFILVTNMPHRILPTIRSRSARMDFGPLSDDEISLFLSRDGRMTREEGVRIARLAGGSLGTALAIDPDFVSETLGRFLALAGKSSGADIISTAESWSHAEPHRMRLIFDLLASFYLDCLRVAATGELSRTIHPEVARFRTDGHRAEKALAEIDFARRTLDTTANKQLMFEDLLFSLAS